MTQRVYESILKELEEPVMFKSVAKRYGISTNTVTRGCDLLDYNLHKLPEVLAIDEFKGNTDHEKYQGTLTNASNLRLLDILPTREKHYLVDYFRQFKREHVKYFVIDLWEPYKDIAETYFPNAMIVIDKYHYVRQVFWSLNQVRKRMQKTLSDKEQLWFKRYRVFLEKPEWKLEPHQKRILEKMLSYDEDLYNAWQLKEILYLYQMKNPDVAAKKLRVFIEMAKEIGLPEYKPTITAFTNWFEYIINAKRVPYTNAFTEGTHNKIKVLKRTGYGYQNYKRFRKRILHLA